MSLSPPDRRLIDQCLEQSPQAWESFVDRFLGMVVHITNHASESRRIHLTAEQRDDLVAEVFLAFVDNDYGVLRRFRRNCSLATYLAVIARRIVVRRIMAIGIEPVNGHLPVEPQVDATHEHRIEDQEQVALLMSRLEPHEATVVRMYHLEGKSYREISAAEGIPENSIGPVLSRARAKLRETTNP